ncbi:MAG: DUF4190 domain-containing protein [Saccharothrix sp.]|nr:DUF4190 domain-containing protein [Saccharothrix sp.]
MSDPRGPSRNGFGVAALAFGLTGLALSLVPHVRAFAWPLVLAGLALGLLGLVKRDRGRVVAASGVAVSALGLAVSVLWAAMFGRAASDAERAFEQLEAEADRESALVFEVTGDAPKAVVGYSTSDDEPQEHEITAFPWSKEFTVKGLVRGGTLHVRTGADGGTVTCRVTVDGVEQRTDTASGPNAFASCSDF